MLKCSRTVQIAEGIPKLLQLGLENSNGGSVVQALVQSLVNGDGTHPLPLPWENLSLAGRSIYISAFQSKHEKVNVGSPKKSFTIPAHHFRSSDREDDSGTVKEWLGLSPSLKNDTNVNTLGTTSHASTTRDLGDLHELLRSRVHGSPMSPSGTLEGVVGLRRDSSGLTGQTSNTSFGLQQLLNDTVSEDKNPVGSPAGGLLPKACLNTLQPPLETIKDEIETGLSSPISGPDSCEGAVESQKEALASLDMVVQGQMLQSPSSGCSPSIPSCDMSSQIVRQTDDGTRDFYEDEDIISFSDDAGIQSSEQLSSTLSLKSLDFSALGLDVDAPLEPLGTAESDSIPCKQLTESSISVCDTLGIGTHHSANPTAQAFLPPVTPQSRELNDAEAQDITDPVAPSGIVEAVRESCSDESLKAGIDHCNLLHPNEIGKGPESQFSSRVSNGSNSSAGLSGDTAESLYRLSEPGGTVHLFTPQPINESLFLDSHGSIGNTKTDGTPEFSAAITHQGTLLSKQNSGGRKQTSSSTQDWTGQDSFDTLGDWLTAELGDTEIESELDRINSVGSYMVGKDGEKDAVSLATPCQDNTVENSSHQHVQHSPADSSMGGSVSNLLQVNELPMKLQSQEKCSNSDKQSMINESNHLHTSLGSPKDSRSARANSFGTLPALPIEEKTAKPVDDTIVGGGALQTVESSECSLPSSEVTADICWSSESEEFFFGDTTVERDEVPNDIPLRVQYSNEQIAGENMVVSLKETQM